MTTVPNDRTPLPRLWILGAWLLTTGSQAATAVSGSMALTGTAYLGASSLVVADLPTATSSDARSWTTLPSDLYVDVAASLSNDLGSSATVSGSASASWLSANQGLVSFQRYALDFQLTGGTVAYASLGFREVNTPDWSYTFVAEAGDSAFALSYSLGGAGSSSETLLGGSLSQVSPWSITLTDSQGRSESLTTSNVRGDDGLVSGSFSAGLTAGETYTVTLTNQMWKGVWFGGPASSSLTVSSELYGTFSWQVVTSPVPEPGAAGLLLAGLATLARWRRQRR